MGFLSVKELYVGREGGLRDGLQRGFTRKFRVKTDDKRVGPLNVIFAPGIPLLYSSYISFELSELDLFAICRDVQAIQDNDDWQVWDVTCAYDTESQTALGGVTGQPSSIGQPGAGGGSGASGDPTLEPPAIEWSSDSTEHALPVDVFGFPILNTAKDPFDPPPTAPVGWTVLRYSRNESSFDPKAMSKFFFKVNSVPFLGYPAESVLCKPITAQSQYIGPFLYYRVNYEFHFANDPDDLDDKPFMPGVRDWKVWLLNVGFRQIKNPGEEPSVILDKSGGHISAPVLLDAAGKEMLKVDIENPNINKHIEVNIYHLADFNTLNIVI